MAPEGRPPTARTAALTTTAGGGAWLLRRAGRRWAAVLLLLVLVAIAMALARTQAASRQALEHRFRDRVGLAAGFVETYIGDLRQRERQQARLHLSGPSVSQDQLNRANEGMGFSAAVLLDEQGRVLQALPSRPGFVGTELASRYAHLRTAVAGQPAVSEVVASAVAGDPIVAFALPFETTSGRRVFSGGFNVERGPIGQYLEQSIPLPELELYLVDSKGSIAATSHRDSATVEELPRLRPSLWRETATTGVGHVEVGGRPYVGVARPVRGTPFRLVAAAPTAEITRPISGPSRALPWVVLGLLAAVAAGTLALLFRLAESARRLESANAELDYSARLDRVTGLYNRRHLEDVLVRVAESARRRSEPFAVVMLDLDRFKEVNDRLGHEAGDDVLHGASMRMVTTLRADDVVGRWGGEEFLVILPRTSLREAKAMAERLRIVISAAPIAAGGVSVSVTASLGCAAGTPSDPLGLVADADAAMYRAKAAGRDAVAAAEPSVTCPGCSLLVPVAAVRVRMEAERRFECPHCAGEVPLDLLEELVGRPWAEPAAPS